MDGSDGRQLAQAMCLAPAGEPAHRLEISPARVLVADVGGKKLPEAGCALRRQEKGRLLIEGSELTGAAEETITAGVIRQPLVPRPGGS